MKTLQPNAADLTDNRTHLERERLRLLLSLRLRLLRDLRFLERDLRTQQEDSELDP